MFAKIEELEARFSFLPYIYAFLGNVSLVIMQLNMRVIAKAFTPFYAQYFRGILLVLINGTVMKMNKITIH